MHGRKHIHRVAALLTAVAALVFFAGSVQAANSRPAGMTEAAYRALVLRSEALDEKYELGKWAGRPSSMSRAAYRALVLRSEALDRKYGRGGSTAKTGLAAPAVVAGSGFAWADFGIGAAAMLGLVLMATGVFAATRRIPRTGVSS